MVIVQCIKVACVEDVYRTDLPHGDGQLVELIPAIADTEEKQQKLLVDNPAKLYWA